MEQKSFADDFVSGALMDFPGLVVKLFITSV